MTGDFSRDTFDQGGARSGVRHQQGRVLLDADWNEQHDIVQHESRTALGHTIGGRGGPAGDVGFVIAVTGGGTGLTYSAGTYYVDGIRIRTTGGAVPELPSTDGQYIVYLDAWERYVTAVEDPSIREVALGGPDTSGRTVITHRVRTVALPGGGPEPTCALQFPVWDTVVAGSTGLLSVRVEPSAATTDPCQVPETAGFRGLENELIRVQIQAGNYDPTAPGGIGATPPTFSWARSNASVVGSWSPPAGDVVAVERLGPGGTVGFRAGQWVEFTNDERAAAALPGVMAEIDEVVATGLRIDAPAGLLAALTALHGEGSHPLVRAWDWFDTAALDEGQWLDLTDGTNSDGIQLRFESGGVWRSGDHWLIAARTAILPGTADRHIEWPVDGTGAPIPQPARGPAHHVARLGIAQRAAGVWSLLDDCTEEFAPLTDLITFVGRGGDGQHAPPGHWLIAPLVVGVGHGLAPLPERRVRFRVATGGGGLFVAQPAVDDLVVPVTATSVIVDTGPDGAAQAWWRLGPGADPEPMADRFAEGDRQEVIAELLHPDGVTVQLQTRFFARAVAPFVLVAAGGDGQIGWPGETLEIAPRARVSAGSRPAAGQRVEFVIANRMDDGVALDQITGGSVHASTGAVRTTLWPGGDRALSAVVVTDAEGVAQVQWVLGTNEQLEVQRLIAFLLDDEDNRTVHQTLFTAHLNVADEVRWRPPTIIDGFIAPGEPPPDNVQQALDLLFSLYVASATGRLRWQTRNEPLNISTVVSLADLPTVVVELPGTLGPPPEAVRGGLIEVSVLQRSGPVGQRMVVDGSVRIRNAPGRTQVEWTMATAAVPFLTDLIPDPDGEVTALVTLRPALFGRIGLLAEWSGAFRIRQ
jgi:hypothetical protein